MKAQLKKVSAVLLLSVGMMSVSAPSLATGIPTFDGAAAANALQSLIQMKTQIENQIKQLTELKSQVQAMSGSRNLGNIATDLVKDQIPTEWQAVYNNAKNTDYTSLLNNGKNYSSKTALQQLANSTTLSEKAFNELKNQLKTLETLQNQINSTQDIKAAADLQNRIAVEQAKINNTQIKLDMMDRMFKQQEKVERAKYAMRESCMSRHMFDKKFDECK